MSSLTEEQLNALDDKTVAELLEWAASAPERHVVDLLIWEQQHKSRVTLISGLNDIIAADEEKYAGLHPGAHLGAGLTSDTSIKPTPGSGGGAPVAAPASRSDSLTARRVEVSFSDATVTRDCTIEGVSYSRGDIIPDTTFMSFAKLEVLLSNRTLLPAEDPWQRKTDLYGPGAPPRKHPTPTYVSPAMRRS